MGWPSLIAPEAITKPQLCQASRRLAYLGWGRGNLVSDMAAKQLAREEKNKQKKLLMLRMSAQDNFPSQAWNEASVSDKVTSWEEKQGKNKETIPIRRESSRQLLFLLLLIMHRDR